MKKIFIFAAVLALLTLSLNAQLAATKKVAKQTEPTEKKVGMHLGTAKKALDFGINRAPARATVEHISTLTFTSACGGSGTADDGVAWTVTSDASESTYSSTQGIHYGTNNRRVSYLQLSTSGIPADATITKIVVNASRGGSTAAYLNVTVAGNAFDSQKTLTTSATNYTFTGEAASGNIVVRISKNSSTGALYCKSIAVTYTTETSEGGGETTDLTVCDGQYYAATLPVYGYYYDEAEHNQMVYPASLLGTAMIGKTIKKMTFYPTTGWFDEDEDDVQDSGEIYTGINFYGGSVTFKLMNLSSGTSAFAQQNPTLITGTMTQVANVTPTRNTSATTWVITFNQDFVYTGGDLLIDVTSTAGTYSPSYFTVDAVDTYRGAYNVSYNNNYYRYGANYLPKVTFTYEGSAEPIHDLAIALDAQPATVVAGGDVTLTATVTNNGDFDETGYTVTFTANGTTINTQTGGALAAGASATFTYTYTTTDSDAGTANFGASVACTDDIVADNNNATASTQVIILPPPENVAATASDNSGTMTWDAPIIPSTQESYSWDFESQSQANEWTLVNADGDSYNWTWDGSGNFKAHSGTGIMFSESYVNYVGALTPDNWMISPEVTLGGTFTLWACGQDTQGYHKEHFGVFVYQGSYSSGTSGFVQVGSIIETTDEMAIYTFDLSQYSGQGRIAIRHFDVTDQYRLNVDDITYQFTASGPQPVSYNIYLEGQLVGNVDANTFSYTFNNLNDGTYNCAVSAVYDLGESAAVPTSFTIDTTNPTIEISPATQTISDAAAGTLTITGTDISGNINVSAADNDWSLNPTSLGNTGGQTNVTYTGRALSASTTVTASATGATDATATVNYVADLYIVGDFGNGWNFSDNTHPMSYANGTYTATITVNANNYILFARLLGNNNPWNSRDVFGPSSNGNWVMQGNSSGGNIDLYDDDPIHFPEGGTYRITINANDGTFTITKLNGEQTAPPVITSSSDGEYVTITATGNGTVTLNVPGQDPVSGDGVVSITVPCGYVSNTITVTATAQETGKDESDPTTAQITIPAGSGWVDMDGTYDDPNTLLSFLKDGEDIMMLDQFTESTLNNRHPDSYIYTLREDQPGGEPKKSTPVPIPVYKTSSTMQGFYTYNQIIADTDMHLKPQVINSKMTYDVKPDGNVLYYNLYRGNVGEDYPVIDDTHRVSKLQQFEENSQFFMFESQTSGVTPRYDHVGNEIVERLDTNYVQGVEGNEISYVPVIWTLGINSARGDGKDNSYGSDIKRETLGAVEPYNIEIERSNGSAWGKWKVPGTNQEYCVYIPTITINGTVPAMTIANDKDKSTYVPFMYRAWCTYPAARAFSTDSETGSLIDLGPMPLPHLLGTEYSESTQAVITDKWDPGDGVLQCSFGGPADEYVNYDDVTFVVRLYYKKVVTEGDNTGSKLGDDPDDAEEYYIVQGEGSADDIETALREMFGAGAVPVSVTYVNAQGMQSSQPFDGLNIVITRYSDGSTTTSKIIR